MLKLAMSIVAVVLLASAGVTWLSLQWTYSDGMRAGYVQKLTKRGWLCKTWEGEAAMATLPGIAADRFQFTVRDDVVAARLYATMGTRVALHYQQHKLVPSSCFGDTEYFVTDARRVTE